MLSRTVLLAWVVLALGWQVGCRPQATGPAVEGVTDKHATVILLNGQGEVADFVRVTPERPLARIEFIAPEDGREIAVTVVGPAVNTAFPDNLLVTTSVGEGMRGKVTVEVEKNIVQNIQGNGISYGITSPVSPRQLQDIAAKLASGKHQHLPETKLIRADKYTSQLVDDGSGNLVPPDMTGQEKAFLEKVIPLARKQDYGALEEMMVPLPDKPRRLKAEMDSLKHALKRGLTRFEFSQLDIDHPDNQHKLGKEPGLEATHSLEPGWELTLVSEQENPRVKWRHSILVGDDDGTLKFIVTHLRIIE